MNCFFLCSYFSSHFTAISPLCHNLFSLYDETNGLWYPPNHEFKITEETSITVYYRMRYEAELAAWLGVNLCWRWSVGEADVSKHSKAFPFCSCAHLALAYARGRGRPLWWRISMLCFDCGFYVRVNMCLPPLFCYAFASQCCRGWFLHGLVHWQQSGYCRSVGR